MATPNLHASEEIVRKIQDILKVADVTKATGAVFVNRFTPFTIDDMNAVNVIQGRETNLNMNVQNYDVDLFVFVDVYATGDSSFELVGPLIDQAMSFVNSIRVDVSRALLADPRIGLGETKVLLSEELSSDDLEVNEDAENPYCVQRMNYLIRYRRDRSDPEFA